MLSTLPCFLFPLGIPDQRCCLSISQSITKLLLLICGLRIGLGFRPYRSGVSYLLVSLLSLDPNLGLDYSIIASRRDAVLGLSKKREGHFEVLTLHFVVKRSNSLPCDVRNFHPFYPF